MNLLRRLWRLEGTVDRSTYAVAGVIGAVVKYAIDWSIAVLIFHQNWTPFSYWRLIGFENNWRAGAALSMFFTLLIVSLPFLWFGMTMTLLRLREADNSAGWAALFFVPVLNLLLFIALAIVPPNKPARARDLSGVLESALFAVIATVSLAMVAIVLSTRALEVYGIGLFVAVPFCVGYLSTFLHARRYPGKPVQTYLVALLSMVLLAGFLLAMAWEGLNRLLHRANRGLERAAPAPVQRGVESTSDAGAFTVRLVRRPPPARLPRFATRPVRARGAARRTYAPDWINVVPAPSLAGGLLAAVV